MIEMHDNWKKKKKFLIKGVIQVARPTGDRENLLKI